MTRSTCTSLNLNSVPTPSAVAALASAVTTSQKPPGSLALYGQMVQALYGQMVQALKRAPGALSAAAAALPSPSSLSGGLAELGAVLQGVGERAGKGGGEVIEGVTAGGRPPLDADPRAPQPSEAAIVGRHEARDARGRAAAPGLTAAGGAVPRIQNGARAPSLAEQPRRHEGAPRRGGRRARPTPLSPALPLRGSTRQL